MSSWPNVAHGHEWGYVTVALLLLVLIIGAWLESRLESDQPLEGNCPNCGSAGKKFSMCRCDPGRKRPYYRL